MVTQATPCHIPSLLPSTPDPPAHLRRRQSETPGAVQYILTTDVVQNTPITITMQHNNGICHPLPHPFPPVLLFLNIPKTVYASLNF